MRLSWLASQLSISAASASVSVLALVSKGLLYKARAEDDGRATALFLTDEGVAACLSCQYFEANRHPGKPAPHHCGLVIAPLSVALLRMDCPEQVPADPATRRRNWKVFA